MKALTIRKLGLRSSVIALTFNLGLAIKESRGQSHEFLPTASSAFMELYPNLAGLAGFEGIPFPEIGEQDAKRITAARKVTPISFKNKSDHKLTNNYLIYTTSCLDHPLKTCHFLGVLPPFGILAQKLYGPVPLEDVERPELPSRAEVPR